MENFNTIYSQVLGMVEKLKRRPRTCEYLINKWSFYEDDHIDRFKLECKLEGLGWPVVQKAHPSVEDIIWVTILCSGTYYPDGQYVQNFNPEVLKDTLRDVIAVLVNHKPNAVILVEFINQDYCMEYARF